MLKLYKVKELRDEIRRCDWNLDRRHFPNMQSDYSNDWAAHHIYFAHEKAHYQACLRHALALENAIADQGIGI